MGTFNSYVTNFYFFYLLQPIKPEVLPKGTNTASLMTLWRDGTHLRELLPSVD